MFEIEKRVLEEQIKNDIFWVKLDKLKLFWTLTLLCILGNCYELSKQNEVKINDSYSICSCL